MSETANPTTQHVACDCGNVQGTHRVECIDQNKMLFHPVWNLTGSWYWQLTPRFASVPRCIDCRSMVLSRA